MDHLAEQGPGPLRGRGGGILSMRPRLSNAKITEKTAASVVSDSD